LKRAPRQTRREKRDAAEQVHARDRFEVALTPELEEAIRKTGPLEPSLTMRDGTPLYAVSIMVAGGQRVAALSSVPPLDDKETCPNCGSRDFEQTTIGHAPWVPDPNARTCSCGAKWKLCGNDLPLIEHANVRLRLVAD
jgi:hypothetical protein